MRMVLATMAGVFVSACCTVADGAVLYEQPTLKSSSDLGAYQYFGQEMADDFSLSSSGVVDTVTWKGGYYVAANTTGTESFTVHVHDDANGVPSFSPFYSFVGSASVTATADMTTSSQTIYDYFLDVTDFALSTGSTYWISIYTNDNPTDYAWSPSVEGTPQGAIRNDGSWWFNYDSSTRSNHVFALNSADTPIPEPSTLIIWTFLGALAITVGWWRRHRAA